MLDLVFVKKALPAELAEAYFQMLLNWDNKIPYFIVNSEYLFEVRLKTENNTSSHRAFTCTVYPLFTDGAITTEHQHFYRPVTHLPRLYRVDFGLSRYVDHWKSAADFNGEVVSLMASWAGHKSEELADSKSEVKQYDAAKLELFSCDLESDGPDQNEDTYKKHSYSVIPVLAKVRPVSTQCSYTFLSKKDVPQVVWNILHAAVKHERTLAIDFASYFQEHGEIITHFLDLKGREIGYVNTGETYNHTLTFNYETEQFRITSWGDLLEKDMSRFPGYHAHGMRN